MRSRIFRKAAALILLAAVPVLIAGTTGKIAGTVADKETGEPFVGANVMIVGTTQGAASDANGNYTILYVPPGLYSVQVTAMGYAKITVSDVRVFIDQTTPVDFSLETQAVAGEAVSIVAERAVMKKDVATSVAVVSATEIRELPKATVQEIVQLNAGVQEGLTIRGGGADEALFQVDGITLRDPRNNQPITGIPLSAIREVSLERGGFSAEYGQVRSGVIKLVTQEGEKDSYYATLTAKASPPQAKHFGMSVFDPNSMWMRPYLDEKDDVCWLGTTKWDPYTQAQYPPFDGWNAVSTRLLMDDDPSNDLSPQAAQRLWKWQHRYRPSYDQPDYNIDAGFGGPVPVIGKKLGNLRFFTSYRREREMLLIPLSREDYLDYDWLGQLTSDISPSKKLKIIGMAGKSYNVAINATDYNYNGTDFGISGAPYWSPTDFMRTPFQIAKITNEQRAGRIFVDSWYCPAEVNYYSLAAKWTHILNAKTLYEASVEHIARNYFTEPIRERSTDPVQEIVPGYWVDESPMGWDPDADAGIDNMLFGGHTSTVRDYSKTSATTFRADLTSQVNFSNLVKTGAEFVYNDLNLNYGEVNYFTGGRNLVRTKNNPLRGALYLQDKLETKGFILNMGLRLDYSNANMDWVNLGVYDKTYYSANYDSAKSYESEKAKSQWSLSPRLSISHPITENSKLFFNYGHFKQLPTYEQMYRIGRGATGSVNNIGDPNLLLAKTVSYELGYDHVISTNYLLQLAAFYHDIMDQQAFVQYISADGQANYFKAANTSYEDIRGFELTLRKTTGRWWTAFLNYTYSVNTAGQFGVPVVFESISEQRRYEQQNKDIYQQEKPLPRPYARAHLALHTPAGFGPKLLGGNPLQNWAVTLIGEWRSGGYFTWTNTNARGVFQNVKIRDFTDVQLTLNKTFNLNKVQVTLFAEVNNLFNTRYLSGAGFYNGLDQIAYLESLHLPKSGAYNNIPGEDKIGDFRKIGDDGEPIAFQPIRQTGNIANETIVEGLIYYDLATQKYMEHGAEGWAEVEKGRMQKIMDDKAYIDMPNQGYFNFLNPRQIFFGIRTSFNL